MLQVTNLTTVTPYKAQQLETEIQENQKLLVVLRISKICQQPILLMQVESGLTKALFGLLSTQEQTSRSISMGITIERSASEKEA
ncbi:hypothetical protein D3C87_1680780 [compost metagenome]